MGECTASGGRADAYSAHNNTTSGQLRRGVAAAKGRVLALPRPHHCYHQVRALRREMVKAPTSTQSCTSPSTPTDLCFPHPLLSDLTWTQLPDRAPRRVQGPHLHPRRRGLARRQGVKAGNSAICCSLFPGTPPRPPTSTLTTTAPQGLGRPVPRRGRAGAGAARLQGHGRASQLHADGLCSERCARDGG